MQLENLAELLQPTGQEALQAAMSLNPNEIAFLPHLQSLSRRFPSELARAALETAILRREAAAKFPFADRLYFTRQALEQASSYEVSSYRAEHYRGFEHLADLGCSLGGDTLALARIAPTVGVDRDLLRLRLGKANLEALNLSYPTTFLQADLTTSLPLAPMPRLGLFFDPSRRYEWRRVFSIHRYQPPLGVIEPWLERFPALGVKISPGVHLEELTSYPAEVEFISLKGELKEAVLWFGPLKTALRRATLLPDRHTLMIPFDRQPDNCHTKLSLSEPLSYLYEPDPAILRSGLVQYLGCLLNASQVDTDIAYLTANTCTTTPFARIWQVEDWLPFNLKRLRAYLHERRVGSVVVKKRGSPLEPQELIRKLRLKGDQSRTLFLTHLRGKPIVVIAGKANG